MLPRTPARCRHFYVSELAPDRSATVVADILRVSRAFNPGAGISGALLFDGERFAQLLEGDTAVVEALAARIAADERHAGLQVRLHETGLFERQFERWLCGWCELDELAPLLAEAALTPEAQLARFRALVLASDTD